jgi:thiamine-phosphate pyrophosphorylase
LSKKTKINPIDRILDANINRLKEGLRVCEEIIRFILCDKALTADFKRIRHGIDGLIKVFINPASLLLCRKSLRDIGQNIYINELKRSNCYDLFFANIQRAKESLRVLEEFSKLKSSDAAKGFKKIRYRLYEIEKKAACKIAPLRHLR